MNVLLVDDEVNARETIKSYLKKIPGYFFVVKEAGTIEHALNILEEFIPDLALLDINLSTGTAFDLLGRIEGKLTFQIVFITAYDKYAIKAFKYNAIDYILKPINPLEFNTAIEKVATTSYPFLAKKQLSSLTQNLGQLSTEPQKLILRDTQAIHFISVGEIIQCKSESNYTRFSLINQPHITISKTLGEYDEILKGRGFFRSHRSYLINLNQIKKYDKREGGYIEMINGESVPLSRNRKETFMRLIESL